jgi:hypothetical protein
MSVQVLNILVISETGVCLRLLINYSETKVIFDEGKRRRKMEE